MAEEFLLDEREVRVLGSLIEKQLTTPEYYPLTLNALVHACNQISDRDPVVAYDEQTVTRALDSLREKNLAYIFYGSESRVPKYKHVVPEVLHLTPAQTAALCVLLLRGPQTVGEIRGRTGRLYEFKELQEVEATLEELTTHEPQPLVARLARQPGRKESRYAQLLSGPVEVEAQETAARPPARIDARAGQERIARLETEVEALRSEVAELKQQFDDFRKQFD
ncbi:MAG TPA: YceH family protein [Pyrinomonadaceae bacterium]